MKPRLKLMGIGAAAGAALLLVFWLLGDVAHVLGVSLQDSSFFIGLICFLISLLLIIRGGKSSKYVVGMGRTYGSNVMQAAINPSLAGEKEPRQSRDAKEIRKAPMILMGAGLLNLFICGLTFLF